MLSMSNQRLEPVRLDASIERSLRHIEALKEALRQTHAIDDEIKLLQQLTGEIRELRELRELRFLVAQCEKASGLKIKSGSAAGF
jgi:hypothetical protein